MIEKYGKFFEMNTIKRDLYGVISMVEDCKKVADRCEIEEGAKRGKCIVCGTIERKLFLKAYDKYQYYECENCGALTLDGFPTVKEMYDSDETAGISVYVDPKIYKQRVDMISKPKADFIIDVIGKSGGTIKTWLDIGCGGAELLYYLKTSGSGIVGMGLETNETELRFARNLGIDVYKKFIDTDANDVEIDMLLRDKDVVSFFNVLEHIEKPVEYIDYLYGLMKKGAYLVFEVPRHPSLGSFANLTSMDRIYRHIVPPVHLQIFSEKSLQILLKEKFEILAKWEFGQGFMDVVNNAMILSKTEHCKMYEEVMRAQNHIQRAIDEVGLADQILLVARRI